MGLPFALSVFNSLCEIEYHILAIIFVKVLVLFCKDLISFCEEMRAIQCHSSSQFSDTLLLKTAVFIKLQPGMENDFSWSCQHVICCYYEEEGKTMDCDQSIVFKRVNSSKYFVSIGVHSDDSQCSQKLVKMVPILT